MNMRVKNNKGFTLIEMLVVIAIVAVLVAVVVPMVSASTKKANAAADAANLRSALGEANVVVLTEKDINESLSKVVSENINCKSYPNAEMELVYHEAGYIGVYFVEGANYYSLNYFSELAEKGSTEISTAAPTVPDGAVWYTVNQG